MCEGNVSCLESGVLGFLMICPVFGICFLGKDARIVLCFCGVVLYISLVFSLFKLVSSVECRIFKRARLKIIYSSREFVRVFKYVSSVR